MKIIITGSVGTGKTTVAKELSKKLKIPVIELSEAIKEIPFVVNKKFKTKEVEIKDLDKWVKKKIKKDWIVEGHLACELNLKPDYIFVLRTHPEEIGKRLNKRKYSKEKIKENVLAEALDYCLLAIEKQKNVFEIDTTRKTGKQSAEQILSILKTRKKPKPINWSSWLYSLFPKQKIT